MPKKKKPTEAAELQPVTDATHSAPQAEDLWTYQLTITRTKPRQQLPDGKLGPSRVEKVYAATRHNAASENDILQEATEKLLNQNPWHGRVNIEPEYTLH